MSGSKDHRLSMGEKVAYGLGDCAANVYVAMAGSFLMSYYTGTAGIAAMAIGTMMLIARLFDGVTDLIMGAIVDKTKSKYGKARPWVLWTAPLMCIGLISLFAIPQGADAKTKLIYAYISYIFMNCIVYTANNLPYNALLSRMTLNVQDRAQTASLRFIMTQLTSLIISTATASLVETVGWFWLSVVYGILEMVLLLICFIGCKEHVGSSADGTVVVQNTPFNEAFPALMKNPYFFLQALLFLTLYVNVVCIGSMGVIYCINVLGGMAVFSILNMANTIPAIVSNFVNPALVGKYGKRKVMIVGCALTIIGSVIIGAAGSNVPIVVVGVAIKGLGMGPIMSGVFALTADVVDYGEWKTGVRSEGLVNSCTSFGMKVGIGLGSAVCTWILAFGGYKEGEGVQQTVETIGAIRFGYGYYGAIMSVVCLVLILLMNIDKNIDKIQADLQAKHHGH